jgi:hypothetical protein
MFGALYPIDIVSKAGPTSIPLVSAFFWCQHSSGARIALVPALLWYQHFSGIVGSKIGFRSAQFQEILGARSPRSSWPLSMPHLG